MPEIISETLEDVVGSKGDKVTPLHTLISIDPVMLNAIYVLGGENLSDVLKSQTKKYIKETFMHYKPLALSDKVKDLLEKPMEYQPGVTILEDYKQDVVKFIEDISVHRHWDRNINI